MPTKRKKQKPRKKQLLEFGKIYKVKTKPGEYLLPAFFYFKPVSSDKSDYTINARVLRAGDEKAWDLRLTNQGQQMMSDHVDEVEIVTNQRELTKVLVRGM